jgi:signal transduction histidine kinase
MNVAPVAEVTFNAAPPLALVNRRWLPWVRALWLVSVGLALVVFVISLPVYWAQLQIVCYAPICPPWQTLPGGLLAIQQLGFSLHDWTLLEVVVTGINEALWLGVGAMIFWKKSRQWIALVVALYLAVFIVNLNNNLDALVALFPVWRLPVAFVEYLGECLPLAVFFLFPDGHFTPRWTRWLTLAFCVVSLFLTFGQFETHDFTQQAPIFQALFMALGLTGVGAQVFRYARRSSPRQRQQTKWVVFGLASAMLGLLVVNVALPDVMTGPRSAQDLLGGIIELALFALIPSSIGIALLREQLWDIDILINRALVYGALSGCVVGIYILVVGYLGTLFQTGNTLPISLIATSLVAMVFQPIRVRLQRSVNRLMYGRRDEPYAVIAGLGRRMEKTLAPEAMLQASVDTVAQALKLPYAAVLLKQGATFRPAAAHGEPVEIALTLPLSYQTEVIGQLALGPRQRGEEFSQNDKRLLEDLARQVSIVAHSAQLTAELQHSREQLVTAREEERRRLRRDLHDGLGPTLGGLTLKVGAIRNLMPTDQASADTLLEELSDEIQLAVSDIRRLVYDLRPPSLDELGLIGAIRAHAAKYGRLELEGEHLSAGHQTDLLIEVEAPEYLPPLPAAVEVAAYRIVLEALTNVARHAQATRCHIRLRVADTLMIEVADNGKGLVADHPAGVGLVSIRERAAELGGTSHITSPIGGGFQALVQLPLPKE